MLALELLEGTWETDVGLLQFEGQSELLRQKDCSEFENHLKLYGVPGQPGLESKTLTQQKIKTTTKQNSQKENSILGVASDVKRGVVALPDELHTSDLTSGLLASYILLI